MFLQKENNDSLIKVKWFIINDVHSQQEDISKSLKEETSNKSRTGSLLTSTWLKIIETSWPQKQTQKDDLAVYQIFYDLTSS